MTDEERRAYYAGEEARWEAQYMETVFKKEAIQKAEAFQQATIAAESQRWNSLPWWEKAFEKFWVWLM